MVSKIASTSTNKLSFTADATPVRPSHVLRLDTEGRRTRYGSPPPPPGASPSLLLPTPGRVAGNASDFVSPKLVFSTGLSSNHLTPLKDPIFTESVDDVENPTADRDGHKRIELHQWTLQFTAVPAPMVVSQDAAELTHWVIVNGKRSKNKGSDKSGKRDEWRSSLIFQRLSPTIVSTSSGRVYELVGPGRADLTKAEVASGYCDLFKEGFPDDWWDEVAQEGRRRGYIRSTGSESLTESLEAAKGREIRRRSRQSHNPPSSPTRRSNGTEQLLLSPENVVDLAKRALKHSNKSISRELRQLQSSKLGNITMVQTAILEGLSKGRHYDERRESSPRDSPACISIEPHSSSSKGEGRKMRGQIPLRASNRARNTTSEWWKVEASPAKMAQAVRKKRKVEAEPRAQSLGARIDVGKASSEADLTEDEYQADSGSSSSVVDSWGSRKKPTDREAPRITSLALVRKEAKGKGEATPLPGKRKQTPSPQLEKKQKPIEAFFIKRSSIQAMSDRSTEETENHDGGPDPDVSQQDDERDLRKRHPSIDDSSPEFSLAEAMCQREKAEPNPALERGVQESKAIIASQPHVASNLSATPIGVDLEDESTFYFSD